jgi:hypothetical protein
VRGADFYDTVKDPKAEPSVWDYVIRSEAIRARNFDDMCAPGARRGGEGG